MTDTEYYMYCGIYERYHNSSLADFKGDADALVIVNKYLDNLKKMKERGIGLFLYGKYGVGKTFLLNASFMEIIKRKLTYSVYLTTFADLCSIYFDSWKDVKAKGIYNRIINVDFLGLDEVNKTTTTGFDKASENPTIHVAIFEELLRYRSVRLKPTWFTSNVSPAEISKRYSPAAYSLLKESATVIHLHGEDYRDKIQDDILKLV